MARAIATAVGPSNAILAVVLACAVLTYGGVSLFVVAFVAWPLARALFAGGSLEAGNAWLRREDISWQGLRAGSSLFVGADTGLGPLYLSLVHAPKGYTGLYLFLGRP